MAGHSKFKNIMHRKGAQDKKRAKIFTKLVKEIIVAVKAGGPEMETNPRLRTAISAAKAQNLPKDRIERALAQASTPAGGENYDEMRYEGYAPGGVAIVIEALTDNKNRAASTIRAAFNKYGGNLGETGSVSFMFERLGMIQYPLKVASSDQIMEAALEYGAQDVISDEDSHIIYTSIEDYNNAVEALTEKFGVPEESGLIWKPQNTIFIDDLERAEKIFKLIEVLEECDDVQEVFGNYEFSDEIYEKLSQ